MREAAFIGVGNMGSALARCAVQAVGAEQVILYNRTPAKAEALAAELGCPWETDGRAAASGGRYVFLCVEAPAALEVLKGLAPALGEGQTVVSVAAGVTLAQLKGCSPVPVLRLMPNTCVAVGEGLAALAAPLGTAEEVLSGAERLLSRAGRVERLEEELIGAFTALAGCGPAFVYPYIEALADGGVMAGLPRGQALRYAAQTVLGAAAMVLETGEHPGALKDAVCSPGGATIAGVASLERDGLRAAGIHAVGAAFQRYRK